MGSCLSLCPLGGSTFGPNHVPCGKINWEKSSGDNLGVFTSKIRAIHGASSANMPLPIARLFIYPREENSTILT
jgi:hypothetical protein